MGTGNSWPPDEDWNYYNTMSEEEWRNSVGQRKCTKDSHNPADTGLRISYCKICETKLVFTDWAWKEADK